MAASPKDPPRAAATRSLAALIAPLARKAVGKRGFVDAKILNAWPDIVGETAKYAQPDRISYPRGQRDGGTLHIRVVGPMATELQHLAPILIERINAHFGYRAVADLRLMQVPHRAHRPAPPPKPKPAPLDPQASSALRQRLEAVEDPDLRAVLERLGQGVLRRHAATKSDDGAT